MLKKFSSFVLLLVCILPIQAVSTSADSAILMEMESGRVLFEQNSQDEKLIASITKLMTALVALESDFPLQEKVEITAESYGTEGSSLYLELGEQLTLETLLYGLLLHSGNDAAMAIAVACYGSEEAFVEKMNETAAALSMEHSHFMNPHGLNAEGHYSSAYDMALLAQACLANETLGAMVATQNIHLEGRSFTNKNKLLWSYEGCIGMKTGYTERAGRTLVSAAERDGMTLICVTLNDRNDWVDHSSLFDYGFETYEMSEFGAGLTVEIPCDSSLLSFVTATVTESCRYPLAKGERISWVTSGEVGTNPMIKGQESGISAVIYCEEERILSFPLIYAEECNHLTVEKQGVWEKLKDLFNLK